MRACMRACIAVACLRVFDRNLIRVLNQNHIEWKPLDRHITEKNKQMSANKQLTETIPKTLMDKLFELQGFMDEKAITGAIKEGPYKEFCDLIVGQGEDPGIFDAFKEIIDQLSKIRTEVAYVKVQKQKRDARKSRITRAEALERALNPNDESYISCPRCSRCMAKKRLAHHQKNTNVCKETWLGRDSTIQNPVRGGIIHLRYIAPLMIDGEYDPPVEEEE